MNPKEFPLRFDPWTYVSLASCGLLGVAIVPACFDDALRAMAFVDGRPGMATNIAVVLAAFLGPTLPCVVLWLRQPGGRIACDDEGITEWDGEDARVFIRWSNLRACTTPTILQLWDRTTGASITVWSEAPVEAPVTRRRRAIASLHELVAEIARRGIVMTSDVDLSRAADPDRPAGAHRWVGRLVGYPLLLTGMVLAARGFGFGAPLLLIGLVGLAIRAYPSWCELRVVRARMAAIRRESESVAATTAYRSPGAARPARTKADERLSCAILLELAARITLGVLAAAVMIAGTVFR